MAGIEGFTVFEYVPPMTHHKPVQKQPQKLKYMGCNICTNCFNCPFEDGCHANDKGICTEQLSFTQLDI
jgi:hypothetical protein